MNAEAYMALWVHLKDYSKNIWSTQNNSRAKKVGIFWENLENLHIANK